MEKKERVKVIALLKAINEVTVVDEDNEEAKLLDEAIDIEEAEAMTDDELYDLFMTTIDDNLEDKDSLPEKAVDLYNKFVDLEDAKADGADDTGEEEKVEEKPEPKKGKKKDVAAPKKEAVKEKANPGKVQKETPEKKEAVSEKPTEKEAAKKVPPTKSKDKYDFQEGSALSVAAAQIMGSKGTAEAIKAVVKLGKEEAAAKSRVDIAIKLLKERGFKIPSKEK